MPSESQLYFDDFTLGERFRSPGRTLGEAHFLLFAGLTGDNHPIHYDEDYARQSRFGARVAHGLLVMAMSALGATALSQRLEASMIAFLEQGGRFLRPVLLGDSVHAEFEVAGLERKGDKGVLRLRIRLLNQRGEEVLEGHHAYLLRCR
ncbi:MAG TPA: MaoC/PaaZ C-terminal domain-containing protein [Candidatus Bathyarchaeia archaeon]|nr:MaoC/PaaZ C-terminal domain-containing protein [Candidatus Bathyarchaeia archaeon]